MGEELNLIENRTRVLEKGTNSEKTELLLDHFSQLAEGRMVDTEYGQMKGEVVAAALRWGTKQGVIEWKHVDSLEIPLDEKSKSKDFFVAEEGGKIKVLIGDISLKWSTMLLTERGQEMLNTRFSPEYIDFIRPITGKNPEQQIREGAKTKDWKNFMAFIPKVYEAYRRIES